MKKLVAIATLGALLFAAAWLSGDRTSHAQQYGGTVWCNQNAFYDNTTNGATVLVKASSGGGGGIYICGYTLESNNTVNMSLEFGTGTNCGTGTTAITPAWQFTNASPGQHPIIDTSSNYRGLYVPAGKDLCILTSAGVSAQAEVYFYQQSP